MSDQAVTAPVACSSAVRSAMAATSSGQVAWPAASTRPGGVPGRRDQVEVEAVGDQRRLARTGPARSLAASSTRWPLRRLTVRA